MREATGRISDIFDKIYEMSVQGEIPLFGEILDFVKGIELYSESSEMIYGGLTSTIIGINWSICKQDLIF